jgi:DNA polymerase III subunit delta
MSEPSDLKSAYLICGTDQPKVRRGAARLRKRVYEETGSDLNISLFDARGQSVADVLQAADTATFTFGTRLLLVSGADTWKAADRDRVAEYLADPVPGVCIALVGETFRKTERLTRLLEKGGQVLRYDLPKRQSDVPEWVRGRARSRGARLGGHEARYLVAQVGADPDTLENELAKLAAYTLGRPIAQADIDAVCSPTIDARIYQLTDAVGRRDAPGAFVVLEALFASSGKSSGEVARSTLFSLVRYIGQLSTVMDLPHEMPASEVAATLGIKPYTAQKLLEQRARFERHTIERALAALADAQAAMVGGSELDAEFSLELALGKVLATR